MVWHRNIEIPAKDNFYFHFTIESCDNMGIVSTLKKNGANLILDCQTPLGNARFFDKTIDEILDEIGTKDE